MLSILEFIYGSKHVSNILFLAVRSKAIDYVFQIFRIYVTCLNITRKSEALCTRRQWNVRFMSFIKVKVKAIPLQAWTGPEGSRRLRLPDFKTIGT